MRKRKKTKNTTKPRRMSAAQRVALRAALSVERARYKQTSAQIALEQVEGGAQRRRELEAAQRSCEDGAATAREQAQTAYDEAMRLAKLAKEATKKTARDKCLLRKKSIRDESNAAIEAAKREREEERRFRREIQRAEGRVHAREKGRTSALERRTESDDEVEHNIEPLLVPLWRRIKRSIAGNARKSRTEQFLQYVEEHAHEVYADEDAARTIEDELASDYERHMAAEEREHRLRKTGGRGRHDDELAEAVPF